MTRFLPTLFSALLMLVLFGKAFLGVGELTKEPDISFSGPGEYRMAVPVASEFTIWHESTAAIDGVYSVREQRLPPGAEIVVEHAGKVVPARVNGSNYMNGSSGDKSSVLSFSASEPGDYLIKVSGFKEKRNFAITRGNGVGPIFAVIGWFLGAGFCFLVFLLFLILALTKAFPKQSEPPRC